jgi:hypothetical protein
MNKAIIENQVAFDLGGNPITLEIKQGQTFPSVLTKDFKGIYEIEKLNEQKGYRFFEKDTMRFFKSKIGRYLGNGIFLTQETNPQRKTAWTVRICTIDGNVATFGSFFDFKSGLTANAVGKRLSKLLGEGKIVADRNGQTFQVSK